MIIGTVSGLLSFWSCHIIRARLRIDDALEVSSIHGVSSIFGVLSVGLFAYRGQKSGSTLIPFLSLQARYASPPPPPSFPPA
jgi:ammonia channel protein AmtB